MSKKSAQKANLAMTGSFYGNEPGPTGAELTQMELVQALNWFAYNGDTTKASKYYKDILIALGRDEDVHKLKNVPDMRLNLTGAWLSRMVMNGCILPETSVQFLDRKIEETLSYAIQAVEKEIPSTPRPSIQDRIREKNSDFTGELLGAIDDGLPKGWSCYEYLKEKKASPLQAAYLAKALVGNALEVTEALDSADKQLIEAYKPYGKKGLEALAELYTGIVVDSQRYSETTKKIRAPRKKKAQSVEKILKSFKYSKSYEDYKIASVDPVKLLGSQVLYTFNWKNHTLTYFKALDRSGLSVKGTTITGFDETQSWSKKIGRKTQETLDLVLNGGKVALRKLQEKSTKVSTPRSSDSVILLKVEK